MQHPSDATDPLITPAAAAKALGLNRSTIHRQIKQGVIHTHQGLVRLSEVEANRKSYIDPERSRRSRGRSGATAGATNPGSDATDATPAEATDVARPFGFVEKLEDPFDRGAMALGMTLAYRIGQISASMVVLSGASCKVAYALEKAMTTAVMEEVADFARAESIGPFATNEDPDVWNTADVEPVNWSALAKAAGEPMDIDAWDVHARERFAEGGE